MLLSDVLSYYVMFPILLLETLLYVLMNIYLLWTWFMMGQWDTIVNKLISIQTICGILFAIGRAVDLFFRLNDMTPSFISLSTYSSCWLFFYYFMTFTFQTSHLSMALVRWVCVRFPLEFHSR